MNKKLDVTIIVPCRNEEDYIAGFISSLVQQDYPKEKMEVIIAEGRSVDRTKDLLEAAVASISWIKVIDNPGQIVSTGLNKAVRHARNDIILRMDVHTEYAHDYVSRCVSTLIESGCADVGGPARTKSKGYVQGAIAAAFASPFAVGDAKSHFEYEGEVDGVSYGCWYKKTLMEVGLWDERFRKNQDDELCLRLRKAGHTIYQTPRIRSWYFPRKNLSGLFRQYFQYGFWKVMVMRKHRTIVSWRHMVPASFVLFLFTATPLGMFWHLPAQALRYVLEAYLAFLIMGSIQAALNSSLAYLPVLPIVIATFHVAYGTGFLCAFFSRTFYRL